MKQPNIQTKDMSFETIFDLCDLLATKRDKARKKWNEAQDAKSKSCHYREYISCAEQTMKLCKYLDNSK